MFIYTVIEKLSAWAPPAYQESYDNAGLITGDAGQECTGILCSLDATEAVVEEAINAKCNLLIAHHPILFKGLSKLSGGSYVERAIIKAIKNDIAIYAIHTNLDNVLHGVNGAIAQKLNLKGVKILLPKAQMLCKLFTYAPVADAGRVQAALFEAGAGQIGHYSECSFAITGTGTFKPNEGAEPVIGNIGVRETVTETKIEVIFPAHLQGGVLKALNAAHPYETVAYEIVKLENINQEVGSGAIGVLEEEMEEEAFLQQVKNVFGLAFLKHTPYTGKKVKKVALCGGSGSFLTKKAIATGADIYLTSDIKYHEFFDADGRILLADIGHWESEQFTTDLIANFLHQNFPTFAVQKTGVYTNPVRYL